MKIYGVYPREAKQLPHNLPVTLFYKGEGTLRANYPFFLPSFSEHFLAHPSVVLRIGRTGKYVKKRFSDRYIDGITVGYHIYAADLLNSLKKNSEPWEPAVAFEGSAVCGAFYPYFPDVADGIYTLNHCFCSSGEGVLSSEKNTIFFGQDFSDKYQDIPMSQYTVSSSFIAEAVEAFSYANVIHTGDLLFLLATPTTASTGLPELHLEETLSLFLGSKGLLPSQSPNCLLRVK